MRLTWALVVAALGPMLIVVGATLLRTEKRAEQDAASRLDAATQQANTLFDRYRDEAMAGLEESATDLSWKFFDLDALLGKGSAPRGEGTEAAHDPQSGRGAAATGPLEIARTLAERRGLDYLEILDGEGRILSNSRMDAQEGLPSGLAGLPETGSEVRSVPVPAGLPSPDAPGPEAIVGRRNVSLANAPLSVVGARFLDHRLVDEIAAITGGPAFLVDPAGAVAVRAAPGGAEEDPVDRISADIPVGDGWRLRVTAPAADAGRARRELGGIVLGIAPFALATALILGILLAQGVSRPIRALASRAEEISAREAAPIRLHPDVDEVRRLTLAFDQMLDALARSEQQRVSAERIAAWQEVAKRIAHEVKNPLSPIKLAVENLLRTRQKAPADFDRALDEESATILEEVESLRRLVDEFSQFARLPAPQLAECDPRAIVESAIALVGPRIEARGVAVEVDSAAAPVTIRADAEQIGRALKNVLLNALDAMETAPDPRLRLVLSQTQASGGGVLTIDVHDTGAGIDPSALKRIFEPYFTTRGDRGGAGLGMAITHRIVFEHGGTIQAASLPGRGTMITIRLPIGGPPDPRV